MPESRPSSTTLMGIASIFVSSFLFDTKTVLMWWQNVKVDKNRKKASVLPVCTLVYTQAFLCSRTLASKTHAVILELAIKCIQTQYSVLADFKFNKTLRREEVRTHL